MLITENSGGVDLESLLLARDQRAARQTDWLSRYRQPVISLTLVTPGQIKNPAYCQNVMGVALQVCDQWLRQQRWPVLDRQVSWLVTGPEAIWCVRHPAPEIKAQCIDLEQSHPLGRLWDFDVICPVNGAVGRRSLNHTARRCLVCDEPAIYCIRSARHSTGEVIQSAEKLIHDWFARN